VFIEFVFWHSSIVRTTTTGMDDNVSEEVKRVGRCHKTLSMLEASAEGMWRGCDYRSFCLLKDVMAKLIAGPIDNDELVLLSACPGTPKNVWDRLVLLRRFVNTTSFAPLRVVARQTWIPILWNDANRLFNEGGLHRYLSDGRETKHETKQETNHK